MLKNKLLIIILSILIFILISSLSAGTYLIYSNNLLSNNLEKEEKQATISSKEMTYYADVNDLILNIINKDGRLKLMKLSFTVKSTEPSIEQILENNQAEIADIVISLISARKSEELLTLGGQNLLKEDLLKEINTNINQIIKVDDKVSKNIVKEILFTTFVMN
ncbi:MAG: flagellar basal body protein FliL [Arcobacter sp.]|nr:MAG: flagellar basal body protein FliL [Arcobacter sp.]